MKLIFIGSGSAFTVAQGNFNSNMLLIDPNSNKKLLIDCGSDARHALNELGYTYRDITDVYISHLHADHAGGLEWLALTTRFDKTCKKVNLHANKGIISDLWEKTLSGGMSTLQGAKAGLSDFFNVCPIKPNESFLWQGIHFQTVQMIHVVNGYALMPSFGLIFEINKTRIMITTDTQIAPLQLRDYYNQVDIIFHDCETSPVPSGVHAHFEDLKLFDPKIKAKMWLYHYNPGPLPDAEGNGFRGFILKGQVFEF